MPGNSRWRIAAPSECRVDHPVFWHTDRVIAAVEGEILLLLAHLVTKMCVAPTNVTVNLLAIRVEQKLVVVEPLASFRSIRAVDDIAIQLPGTHFGQIAVPDHVRLI